MRNENIFERTEKKYVISLVQMTALLNIIDGRIRDDEFGESTVRSIYFDTDDFRMIRASIEKPLYKEKLRIRSYSRPGDDDTVFLELKKKYRGIVYKRREKLKYSDAKDYIYNRKIPEDTQIMHEIDWTVNFYNELVPKMFICYDRRAYYGAEDSNLRITFDKNLKFRTTELELSADCHGENILDSSLCVMEIKALNAMPLWLCDALNELEIYPSSFSKYGTAYSIITKRNGGESCA